MDIPNLVHIFEAAGVVSQTSNPSVDCFQHHAPNRTQHGLLSVIITLVVLNVICA